MKILNFHNDHFFYRQQMCPIACGGATKLNKCRCKSRVIFTAAAAGILIFTAEVGLIVRPDPLAIEKDLSIQICHTLLPICIHTHFSRALAHLLRRTPYKFDDSMAIAWPKSQIKT